MRYVVDFEADLRAVFPITRDEVTDLVEVIVDELDVHDVEPDVGTSGTGDVVQLRVAVIVKGSTEFEALTAAATLVQLALTKAGVVLPHSVEPAEIRSRVHELEPA